MGFVTRIPFNRELAASLGYQVAALAAQAGLFGAIFRAGGISALDDVFLSLAYLVPPYVFLLLGGRQILFSGLTSGTDFVFSRAVAICLFLMAAIGLFFAFDLDRIRHIFYLVTIWKVFDLSVDLASAIAQNTRDHCRVAKISLARISIIAPAFIINPEHVFTYIKITMLAGALGIIIIASMGRRQTQLMRNPRGLLKRMLALGAVAALSAMIISVPRAYLGAESGTPEGVLAFIGVFSYLYIIGQVAISSLTPVMLMSLRTTSPARAQRKLRSIFLAALAAGAIAMVSLVFLIEIASAVAVNFSKYNLLALALVPVILTALACNLLEPFSSLLSRERVILVGVIAALVFVAVLSPIYAPRWGGVGYALVVSGALALRLLIVAVAVLVVPPKNVPLAQSHG